MDSRFCSPELGVCGCFAQHNGLSYIHNTQMNTSIDQKGGYNMFFSFLTIPCLSFGYCYPFYCYHRLSRIRLLQRIYCRLSEHEIIVIDCINSSISSVIHDRAKDLFTPYYSYKLPSPSVGSPGRQPSTSLQEQSVRLSVQGFVVRMIFMRSLHPAFCKLLAGEAMSAG